MKRTFQWMLCLLLLSLLSIANAGPVFNIDFGSGKGSPSAEYGAASGQSGYWNTVSSLGLSSGIVSTDGNVTTVSVTTFGTGANGGTGSNEFCPCSDQQSLLSDMFFRTGGSWTVTVDNLEIGHYDIFAYAPSHPMPTGILSINGIQLNSLSGNGSSAYGGSDTFFEGVNWGALSDIYVADGSLSITSNGTSGYAWSGLAGLQIVQEVPTPSSWVLFLLGLIWLNRIR